MESYYTKSIEFPTKFEKFKEFRMITPNEYNLILKYNYTIPQLKLICNKYNIKHDSKIKKNTLREKCYYMLKYYNYAYKIQRVFRKFIINVFINTQGPAFKNRDKCNNIDDFLTTENVKDISFYNFISYIDNDKFIYGFNIKSLYKLFENNDYKNPYTRNDFNREFIILFKRRLCLNKMMKKFPILKEKENISIEKKAVQLFQKMDYLDNYTKVEWLLDLSTRKLILFFRELYDIWNFRAQLSFITKRNICPPNGNPFSDININIFNNLHSNNTDQKKIILKVILNIIQRLISTGNNKREYQKLGAFYVLSAITLVNNEAAQTLPWLYESVAHVS